MTLTELPNIGPKLADNLRRVGVSTPEQLREMGTPLHPRPGRSHRLLPPAHRPGRRGGRYSQEGAAPGGKSVPADILRHPLIENKE